MVFNYSFNPRKGVNFISVIGLLAFILTLVFFINTNSKWYEKNWLIAHGFGEIEGKCVTNSLEAFYSNYEKGIRVFEVDLILTSDNNLVAKHDWEKYLSDMFEQNVPSEKAGKPLSLKEFKSMKIYKKYTPLSFRDIAILMKKYQDIYIVTDTKGITKENITILVNTAKEIDPNILDRIIVQIYNQNDLKIVKSIYNFKSIIYTLYMTTDSNDEVIDFTRRNGIEIVTMSTTRFSPSLVNQLAKYGILSFVHTVNSPRVAAKLRNQGVYGFYTDRLTPRALD